MYKTPIIFDCDPGHDDAIALIMALSSDKLDIKAITTTAGNQTQEKILRNTINILGFLNKNDSGIMIGKGLDKPLIKDLIIADNVHGESGLDGPVLPENKTHNFIINSSLNVMKNILENSKEKITIVATGPLTNVAVFLTVYPELKNKIEKISLMGGACFGGNITSNSEFNIFVDPEAAKIVFDSGVPIVMSGLDVTLKAQVYEKEIIEFKNYGRVGTFVSELLEFFHKTTTPHFLAKEDEEEGAHLHDPCAVAYLLDESIFTGKQLYVTVDKNDGYSNGQTVVDYGSNIDKNKNAYVLFDLKREALIEMIKDACIKLN
ncbi:MAG: nucleoside hydrolase [Cetobacterium sp.]|uniref:nucleoside hydrolase n=1 Tax=Cetobacterium sp. TaxID=2071632 RepID=UPI002FCC2C31